MNVDPPEIYDDWPLLDRMTRNLGAMRDIGIACVGASLGPPHNIAPIRFATARLVGGRMGLLRSIALVCNHHAMVARIVSSEC
jgi:hypothetical protein